MSYLKYIKVPLIFEENFTPTYPNEKKHLLELIKDECAKALDKMQLDKRYDPYNTILITLENAKKNMHPYILNAKGPEPHEFAEDFEDWECYDPHLHGFDREVMYENFWKGGGREREAESKVHRDWQDADEDMKHAWMIVINDTISTLREGEQIEMLSLEAKSGRRIMLERSLNDHGLILRSDSALCNAFINYGSRNIDNIVQIMSEMSFLYEETDYRRRVSNRDYGTSIEILKLFAVKKFIEDFPERVGEIPKSLLDKLEKRNENANNR